MTHSEGVKQCLQFVTMASLQIRVGKKVVHCIYLRNSALEVSQEGRIDVVIGALHDGLTPESTNATCRVRPHTKLIYNTKTTEVAPKLCMAQRSDKVD